MDALAQWIEALAGFLWNKPVLWLIIGGGVYFTLVSRLLPFRYGWHAIRILRGDFDDPDDPGHINHFQALCSALSGTIGMGNIGGVAVAISTGGPGALFWMWVSALVGMSTKFFTCTLSVMYRGRDEHGTLHGGPMYYILEGLGPRWKPLALMFAFFGLFGCLPLFQANQLTGLVRSLIYEPHGWFAESPPTLTGILTGVVMAIPVGMVIVGGIKRIGRVASLLVPAMVAIYVLCGLAILLQDVGSIPGSFALIFQDAFSGQAVAGGVLGAVISQGIRRGAFSNEAGLGTEAMAHGAARTKEPVREGLVAMVEPFLDTIIVCTLTGLILVNSGLWDDAASVGGSGVLLTQEVFRQGLGPAGPWLLLLCVLCFCFSTMLTYSHYVNRCGVFLFGTRAQPWLTTFYLGGIVLAAAVQMDLVLNILDSALALMAIPTTGAAILLAPRVLQAAKTYFSAADAG